MAEQTKKAKRSKKAKIPKTADIVTKFENQTSRLSLNKSLLDIYDDKGTIFHNPSDPIDMGKWTFEFDDVEEKEENRYGRAINSGGNPEGKSEITSIGKTTFLGSVSSNIQDAGASATSNRAHNEHEQFKLNMEAAMRANNMNNTGMINDTKRKEHIDLIAGGRNEQVDQFVNKTGKHEDFSKNVKLKYEDKYTDNPTHRSKKKVSDFKRGSASKEDGYNKLYPLPDEMNKLPTEDLTWKDWDFIPFILHDLVNRKYLPFRSFINSISDQSDAEWQDIRYLGRADNVQVYTGFARTLSIDFTTVAFTLEELHPMWQRLNYLVGLTKPAGYTSFANDEAVIPTSAFIIPPFVKFNLGDMYKDQPCVMTSVSLSIPQEASWELTPDKKTKNEYDFLNKTITKSNQLVGQYPDMVQVSLSFKLLEKRLPKTNNRHFGHYRKEDDPENQDIPDDGPDIKKGFNYNLIYPNPQNPEKNMMGMVDPNEEPVDPSKKGIGGDPFEGNSEGVCTTYPPSHYYLSRGNKSKKKEEKIQKDLDEWKQCACEQTAKLMGLGDPDNVPSAEEDTGTRTHSLMDVRAKETLDRTGKSHVCNWNDDGCIESVNGIKVPVELECKYNTFTNEEPTEEENPKPPRCPSPIGGFHEKDDNQPEPRVIGYTDSNKFEQNKNNKEYMDELRNRNLAYWIKDVSDYLATEMNSPQIGNGPYTYNSKSGLVPTYSQIKKVSSSNGSVVLEFDDNGHPFSYAGNSVNRNISQDFKIDCEDEDFNEIREIAGNLQPKIIVDTESDFKIILNEDRGHVITKDNYDNINGIKRWLSSWVSNEMRWIIPSANEPEGRTTWKDSFLNLKGKWANDVWTEYDIYYAPYEEDPEEQSIAYKVFPGTSEYVNYEIDTNISENLGLDAGGPKYAELKFGFYAIVSKEKEKLSTRDPDRWFEQDLADKLYEKLFTEMNNLVGNASKLGSENTGLTGDGTELQTDESTRDFLNPTNSGNEEKLLLLKEKKATEARVDAQLLNENIICIDYTLVGKWNPTQASEIMSRMKNMSYQPLIKEKRQLGSARIDIENYVILMLGTTEAGIQAADVAYQTASRKGRLVAEDRELARFTEQDFLQAEIERIEADMEKNTADSTDEFADFKHGVFFSSPDSDNHFEPWVRDHKYDKIEWRDGSNTLPDDPRPGRKPKVIGEPRPTTESPTPNTKPTWTWKPVDSAIQYDVEFPSGIHSLVSTNFFKPTDEFPSLKKLEYKSYTIKVKAGRRAHGSGEMEWSTAGIHTVAINKKAIPPKPPRCPYKVMDVGEKDEHDRLIGPASYDEPLETTIERNVKTWMGDVMAYIMAKEELGVLEYPSNPENIVWNTNNERAVSMSGRNQLEWTYNGNAITNLGFDNELEEIAEPGFPTTLNGTALGAAEDGSLKYANDFDCGCGPSLQTDAESGSNTNEPADLELEAPRPSSNETTTNMKPRWTWKSVRGANMYEVSLKKGKANYNADGRGNAVPWVTEEDYGTIQFSDSKKANPPFGLDVGTYEISVVALYQENGQVTKKSNAGTHIVKVLGGGTPTPTQTPTPTGEYMKLIKDAFVGNNGIYVNDRSCIEVGGTITINRKDKQEEAIVTGFSPRQKVTANATGLGSWGYNYTSGNDPVKLTINSKSDQIARMIADILKLRSDVNCSESDLNSIKDCFFGKDCKFPSFETGIANYNNEQISKLYSSLQTALSASVGRGNSDLPAKWFFSSAKSDTKPFGVSADLIAYDSNIFGSQLKDILDTAVNTHLDAEVEAQTATGEGLVILQSGIKFDHEENTKVICGEAPLQPTPTSIPIPTPTPITSLSIPVPSSPTPTNNKKVVWHWLPVNNASVYEVSVKKLEPSSGTGTAGKMIVIWDEVMWERPETEFTMTFTDDGYYEISVIAKNTILKLDSAPGKHMVYINEDITPTPMPQLETPTPTITTTITPSESECDAFVYGNDLYLEQESGYCPDNDESALTRWWTRAIEYCVCKWWNNQPKSVRESKGLYRIYNFPFSVSAYTNEFSVKLEDFHNPQNITASSPIKRSANYEVQVQFTQGKFPNKQGFESIPWSELYPHWKAKGFTRYDSSKGEQCPFSDSESETPTPTSQFECPEIISDLNEYPGYCPNPSDEVALEYWKQVIKYYLCKKIKDRYGESAYIKSYNFKATGRRTTILHSPIWLGRSGSGNWLPFETTCTVVKPDGTTTTSGLGFMTASATILKRDISPIELTGNKYKCKELNSTPTPSPTPIASAENPFVLPSFYLDQVDGICENTESMKNDWYAAVAKWVAADDYLENFPSYIIRTAIPTFSGTSTELDKPNDLKEWPAMIKLKYYNRDTKSEEELEVSYSEVNSLAKQNGFGLSDPSKSLTELCKSGSPEFGNFLKEIEAFSRDKAYTDGDKVFYPTANKNAFFNSFDNEDKYLTLQEGISKYSNDPNFTIYQVYWEDVNLTRFIDSTGRPTTENKVPPVNLAILSDKDTDTSLKRSGFTDSQIMKWKLGNPGRNVRGLPNTSRFWLSDTSEMKPKSEAVRGPAKESMESEDY